MADLASKAATTFWTNRHDLVYPAHRIAHMAMRVGETTVTDIGDVVRVGEIPWGTTILDATLIVITGGGVDCVGTLGVYPDSAITEDEGVYYFSNTIGIEDALATDMDISKNIVLGNTSFASDYFGIPFDETVFTDGNDERKPLTLAFKIGVAQAAAGLTLTLFLTVALPE